jgi:hypothetical protein
MADFPEPLLGGKGQPATAASFDADESYAWGPANNFATVVLPKPGMSIRDRASREGYDTSSQETVRYVGQTDQFPVEVSIGSSVEPLDNVLDMQDHADSARVVQLAMEGLYLISFTRSPSALRVGLTEGPYLKLCREKLVANGHEYELGTGAKIFCEPEQYAATRAAVKHLESTFRPYHVVATEKHLPNVLYTVRSFPHSLKVKVKSSRLIAYIGGSGETQEPPARVKRNANRHVGGGSQVDVPRSGTMPLFVQLAQRGDASDDQHEAGVNPSLPPMLPHSEYSQPMFVDPLQAGQPQGMRWNWNIFA